MPLVIYTGIHAMMREPEFQLPAGTQMLTLEALTAESPAAVPESQQVLWLEKFSEKADQSINLWLKREYENKAIIVWPSPTAYVSAMLAAGKNTDEALEQWQQLATSVLKIFRSHRRQLKLVSAVPGGELPAMDDITLATLPAQEHSPIYTLAAKQLVDASETLTQTTKRMLSSSEFVYKTNETVLHQVNSALLHHQQQTVVVSTSKQKIDELIKQSEKEHQEKEKLKAANKQQIYELARQKETDQQLSLVQEESDMVIAELHRVQELLEAKLYERDELVKQRDKLNNECGVAMQQCATLTHERNIAAQQRVNALQQLDLRLKQLEKTQKQFNVSKEFYQNALHERDAWIQWLQSYAYRFIKTTYRHSRVHRKLLSQQVALLKNSTHFDAEWYKEQYPDLAQADADPAEHYLKFGAIEGRNPSAYFNTRFYVTQNPDVATAGYNPLLHYVRHGQIEGRKTNIEQLQLPSPQSSSQATVLASQRSTQEEEKD